MADPAKAELLRSLGRVARGLSALFWGLPLGLVFYIQIAQTDWLMFFGMTAFGPLMSIGCLVGVGALLWHGLSQMRPFQKQERIWQSAISRAEVLVIINIGLSPFLFWWHRMPFVPHFACSVSALTVCELLFLMQINHLLVRLTAMLPDEMLRSEARLFAHFNTAMLMAVLFLLIAYLVLIQFIGLPLLLQKMLIYLSGNGLWMALFMTLMPLAMTMALLWKIKEFIFASLFSAEP